MRICICPPPPLPSTFPVIHCKRLVLFRLSVGTTTTTESTTTTAVVVVVVVVVVAAVVVVVVVVVVVAAVAVVIVVAAAVAVLVAVVTVVVVVLVVEVKTTQELPIIILMMTLKGAIHDFVFSFLAVPRNCLKHVRTNGQGAIVRKSRATHRAFITRHMMQGEGLAELK